MAKRMAAACMREIAGRRLTGWRAVGRAVGRAAGHRGDLLPVSHILDFATSFKNLNDSHSATPHFFNFTPTLDNYRHIFFTTDANGNAAASDRLPAFFLQ